MKNGYNYFILVGCGDLGSHLAKALSRHRKSIVIIDKNEAAFNKLTADFSGFAIEGDGVEEDVLLEAEINRADVVIAVTGDDNTNIMIAQIAKVIYNVPKVVARLYEPSRGLIYEDLDIETICPTVLSMSEFSDMIALDLRQEHPQ